MGFFEEGSRMLSEICEEFVIDFEEGIMEGTFMGGSDGEGMGEEEYSMWFGNWEEWQRPL